MIGGAKGIGIGIDFGIPNQYCRATSKPYIEKDVLDSLRVVASAYGKSNNDADRSIIKNLVDPDNPFVISNAAFKLNSGFGKYEEDFTTWSKVAGTSIITDSKYVLTDEKAITNGGYCLWNRLAKDSFKVKISNIPNGGWMSYRYRITEEDTQVSSLFIREDGIYTLPATVAGRDVDFFISTVSAPAKDWVGLTITQIPSFEGAFVTDGIDDLITSTKTVQEMLGGSNEITVVSMIHQIDGNVNYTNGYTNYIRHGGGFIRNSVSGINGKGFNKTGIYGYTSTNLNSSSSNLGNIVNNILGDKDDYSFERSSTYTLDDAKYSVQNFVNANNQPSNEGSSVAWYWTIIANKVLTTDQINQVIAYFNLDRTLKPDILCDVKKQGITNDNHAEFGDKLIDFSGNGRDIQLNNIAWKGDSGIGKYETELSNTSIWTQSKETTSSPFSSSYNGLSGWIIFANTELTNSVDMPSFKIQVKGLLEGQELIYRYYDSNGQSNVYSITKDGDYTLPSDFRTAKPQISNTSGFQVVKNEANIITITQIPSHAGALCLDGVNDFGQFVGDLGLKDYTFIMDREYLSLKADQVPVISSINPLTDTPFIFEHCVYENRVARPFSFGKDTVFEEQLASKRFISYQSTYKYNGKDIARGTSVNTGSGLTIGRYGDDKQYANFVLYFLMLFPYSMSEFLIERQLKKHKLGTLYPDMVEFRPVIKSNVLLDAKPTFVIRDTSTYLNAGDYVPENSQIWVSIKMNNAADRITKFTVNGKTIDIPENAYSEVTLQYGFPFVIDKSPQKIGITIEQDENMVLFNPTINSNAIFEVGNEQNMTELIAKVRNHEIDGFIMYLSKLESKYILPNSWINKDTEVISSIYCLDNILQDDLHINIDGNSKYCLYADSSNNISEFLIMDDNVFEEQYITNVLTANTIDIQLDQYIRYEDIVQPYPVLLRFNDENGNEVSWGGKFRVGSTITRIGSISDPESNLLNGLYSVSGLSLNGKAVTSSTSIVEKQMVFRTTATWLLDNNEPKVILSPRLLRIPNSSYKILGYIPDISGHGNHGKINNSAYAEGSGVNEDGSYQFDGVDDFVTIPTLSSGGKQVLMKVNWSSLGMPIYEQRTPGKKNFAIISNSTAVAYIEGNDGNTYIDGILNNNIKGNELVNITHNITITNELSEKPNTSPMIGMNNGRNAFAKMSLYDFMLFDDISTDDKIKELNEYVGIEAKVELPPYYWDNYGKTNLDEDKNYTANLGTVKDVIEVSKPAIFAENWYDYYESFVSRSPIINQTDYSIEVKPTHMDSNFMMMLSVDCDTPLPAFRAKFTRTSNVDVSYAEIRYVYYVNGKSTYIDIFGENNSAESVILDIPASEKSSISGSNADNFPNILIEVLPADNSTFYGLTNTNFAYDKMSGFGGYEFAKFDNTNEWINDGATPMIISRNGYSVTLKKVSNIEFWRFINKTLTALDEQLTFKVRCDKAIKVIFQVKYFKNNSTDVGYNYNYKEITLAPNEDTTIIVPPISVSDIPEATSILFIAVLFDNTSLSDNEEYTIEMLPLYPNGLVYDGITDYSENVNIPAFTDYTYIFKRELLDASANTCSMYKGILTEGSKTAFVSDYDKNTEIGGRSFGNYVAVSSLRTNKIIYGTKASVNGDNIVPGNNVDALGLVLGKYYDSSYKKMVFYKLILYPKTIPLLQINFLKNLMERDEIIDLNNKIFIQE